MHKGQEDNLIFLGDPQKTIRAEFVDFRRGSATFHKKITLEINPSPEIKLVIPPGVAHAFWGMENVFTFNRPRLFLNDTSTYFPANDTHDWPITDVNYPAHECNNILATQEYYDQMAEVQRQALLEKNLPSTPISILTKDADGNQIRVVVRKKASELTHVVLNHSSVHD